MRDAPRLHVEATLEAGAVVTLDEDRHHYLLHVMRAAIGDPVRLFNARSGEWDARIARATRHGVGAEVSSRRRPPGGTAGPILLFAPLKRDATDLVVRMATELGVTAIRPVVTERTIAGRVNLDRLASIAREAAEQCERLDLPCIEPPASLASVLDGWPAGRPVAVAVERSAARPLGRRGSEAAEALLVGPEGGFTPAELDALARHPFVQPVSLGSLVLRADTACAAGLALLRLERLECDVEPG